MAVSEPSRSERRGPSADPEIVVHANILVPSIVATGFPSALDVIADEGAAAVVLPPIPEGADLQHLRAELSSRRLVPIVFTALRPGSDIGSVDPEERDRGRTALLAAVHLAVELGGDHVTGVPYAPFGRVDAPFEEDALRRSAAEVGRIADLAAAEGVRFTLEVLNRYETSAITTAEQARRYVELSESEHLGIHLDGWHMAIEEADALGAVRATAAAGVLGHLELGQSGRGALGSGAVDCAGLVRAGIEAGYRGRIGFEAFSRSVIGDATADRLKVWREPYSDGIGLIREGIALIRRAAAEASQAVAA